MIIRPSLFQDENFFFFKNDKNDFTNLVFRLYLNIKMFRKKTWMALCWAHTKCKCCEWTNSNTDTNGSSSFPSDGASLKYSAVQCHLRGVFLPDWTRGNRTFFFFFLPVHVFRPFYLFVCSMYIFETLQIRFGPESKRPTSFWVLRQIQIFFFFFFVPHNQNWNLWSNTETQTWCFSSTVWQVCWKIRIFDKCLFLFCSGR